MSEEKLNEIIENINKHNILQSCCGGMTSYDCMISELAEYALDLQQRKDKAINDLNIIIDIIKKQPSDDDSWLLERLESNKKILQGKEVK